MLFCIHNFVAVSKLIRVILQVTHRDHARRRDSVAKASGAAAAVEFIKKFLVEYAIFEYSGSVFVYYFFEIFEQLQIIPLVVLGLIKEYRTLRFVDILIWVQLPNKVVKIRQQIQILPPKAFLALLVLPEHIHGQNTLFRLFSLLRMKQGVLFEYFLKLRNPLGSVQGHKQLIRNE